jgi:hypothetical protein
MRAWNPPHVDEPSYIIFGHQPNSSNAKGGSTKLDHEHLSQFEVNQHRVELVGGAEAARPSEVAGATTSTRSTFRASCFACGTVKSPASM